jgi:hypothetical protein
MSNDPLDLHRRRSIYELGVSCGRNCPTPNGSSCDSGDTCGRFGGGIRGPASPFLERCFAPSGADAWFTVLTPLGSDPARLRRGRPGTLDFSPVVSPASKARLLCTARASLSRAAPFYGAWPASSRAAARFTLGAARIVRRATDGLWACPRPCTAPDRRVRPGGRDPNGTVYKTQVPIVRNFSR